MAAITLKQISKWFSDNQVIKNIDLNIRDGEFVVFVGPSGCGKSTLLRIISGLEDLDNGSVSIDDIDVTDKIPYDRGISMVFQSYALYPHMNVFDNIGFSLKTSGVKNKILEKRVKEIAKILRLDNLLHRLPKQLSGGQKQRVAIGRAIIRKPKAFLFDEPLSNLDAALRVEMRLEISKLHKELGVTTIYVTHDQVEAMTLADKIVVLNEGKIIQIGSPFELYNYPENLFVAQFIGTPKMNIFKINSENIVSNNKINILGSSISFSGINLDKKNYYIGIRPEHLTLNENQEFNFTPKIELIENLGNEKIVYMVSENNQLCAKISSDIQINNKLGFNLKNVLLFDENGLRIRY